MRKLGFIGLGIMGRPMAKNLLKAGFSLTVFNRSKGAVEELVNEGALSADSPKEVALTSEGVITMLPDSPDVEEVILGKNGVILGARPGSVVIDMSSINPLVTKNVAEELKKHGVAMLDAPVSGGETGAIQGSLAIMAGGDEAVFKECLPIFEALGKNIIRVGGIGAGGFAKLVNQIIVALNIAAVGESFSLGVKAGLDPQTLYHAIRGGLAGSSVLDAKTPMIMGRNFKPGFKINLHLKDLNNALSTAKDLDLPLPLTGIVQQILISLFANGRGELDHSAIATFFENVGRVEIKSIINGQ